MFAAPDEFNRVVVLKKFHFWLPVVEMVLVLALLFITAANPSSAGIGSVMTLIAGEWAVVFWVLFVAVGLVIPTILELWMLWVTTPVMEHSRTGQMISGFSDLGVLVGGFVLRLDHRERGPAHHHRAALELPAAEAADADCRSPRPSRLIRPSPLKRPPVSASGRALAAWRVDPLPVL